MDAQTFLYNLGTIAEAPGGTQRLRDLVLGLALGGKLVPQDPSDEPAVALLTHRDTKRNHLALPDAPYTVPQGWLWARFGDVADCRLGKMLDKAKNVGPLRAYLRNANVQWFKFDLSDIRELRLEERDLDAYTVQVGDLVICEGGDPGRAAVCDASVDGMVLQKALHRARPKPGVDAWYLAYLLRAMATRGQLESFCTGATIKHLTGRSLANVPVPLPPTKEQKRIVAKVDELMGLCDDLVARQERRCRSTTRFRRSALYALVEAESPKDLHRAWERVRTNWPVLMGHPDSLTDLRQNILQLAVEGRLTRSAPTDEPVTRLLERASPLTLDFPDLVEADGKTVRGPHGIPPTWEWVALGGVTTAIVAGWSAPAVQRPKESAEWGVLKVSACSWGEFRPGENKALQPGTQPKESLEVKPGDFLISRANTSPLVARSVVVRETPPRLMLSDKTLRISPAPGCNTRYLNLANLASAARRHYESEATGTSDSMKNVSQRVIRRAPIPLPPREEQDRIVAVVERLNSLCDDLEVILGQRRDAASRLAGAVLSHIA